MKLTTYVSTDPGLIRGLNEDSVRTVHAPQPELATERGDLLVVADGMGGHDAGEIASAEAVETISRHYYQEDGSPAVALTRAIEQANARIFARAQHEERYGMGTTVVAAAHVDGQLHIAHVGDSRLYLIRDGAIRSMTDDHSLVAEQVAAGILTPEEATRHPHRNVISRAVGTGPTVEVEVSSASPLRLQEGDVVLLCSDGLTEHLSAQQIMAIVANTPPERAAQALVTAANAAGGSDNITVLLGFAGEPGRVRRKGVDTAPMPALSRQTGRLPAVAPAPPETLADADTATIPLPVVTPPPQRVDQGGGRSRLLWLLLLGAVAIGAAYWALTSFEAEGSVPDAAPVAATVTIEEVVAPTAAVPPAPQLRSPPGELAGGPRVMLVAPADGERIVAGSVTFQVRVEGLAPEHLVELWMGPSAARDTLRRAATFVGEGPDFEVVLTTPPDGQFGAYYWAPVLLLPREGLTQPDLQLGSEPRQLLWESDG